MAFKVKLDDKYQAINNEFSNLKVTNRELKSSLGGKLRNLRNDFDEWKNQEPIIIKNKPNKALNDTQKPKIHPSLNLEQKLIKLRTDLPHLTEGEHVLAKWPANGWYYHSTVYRYLGDFKYKITGTERETTESYREDLISLNLNDIHSFEVIDVL